MKTIAFIFARGGSKGLPGKNLRELGGIPLVAHSIRIAQQVESITQIYVSTDCEKIASVAIKYGAEIILRPAELASDTASEWKAWQHAVQHLQKQGTDFDVFVSLPATSPLRSVGDVESCICSLDERTDIVVTVTPAARSPYFNMLVRDGDGVSRMVIQDKTISRRQDAPVVFDMTTVAYVTRPNYIMDNSSLFVGSVKSIVIPKQRAVDIDDEYDFQVAEAFYKCLL